jgi:hypothetical protein
MPEEHVYMLEESGYILKVPCYMPKHIGELLYAGDQFWDKENF